MALIRYNGIDHLAAGTPITAANSGDAGPPVAHAFDAVDPKTGNVVASSSRATTGGVGIRFWSEGVTDNPQAEWTGFGGLDDLWIVSHLLVSPIPSGTTKVFAILDSGGTEQATVRVLNNGKVSLYDTAGTRQATTTAAMADAVFSRVDIHVKAGTTTGELELDFYTTWNDASPAETLSIGSLNTGTIHGLKIGVVSPRFDQQVAYDELSVYDADPDAPVDVTVDAVPAVATATFPVSATTEETEIRPGAAVATASAPPPTLSTPGSVSAVPAVARATAPVPTLTVESTAVTYLLGGRPAPTYLEGSSVATKRNQNVRVPAGEVHTVIVTVGDLDLTGVSSLVWTATDGTNTISKSLGSGVVVTASTATVTLDAADTSGLGSNTLATSLVADGETLATGTLRVD